MGQMPKYRFPFNDQRTILHWVARYHEEEDGSEYPDGTALDAGLRILHGELTGANARAIYRWKMQSYLKRFDWVRDFPSPNTDDEITRALRVAVAAARNETAARIAMDALCNLRGVKTPVASAFLTAIHPELFTVIDRQVYKSLGHELSASVSTDEYFYYLTFCRDKARDYQVSLRNLDRALVMFGTEMGKTVCR